MFKPMDTIDRFVTVDPHPMDMDTPSAPSCGLSSPSTSTRFRVKLSPDIISLNEQISHRFGQPLHHRHEVKVKMRDQGTQSLPQTDLEHDKHRQAMHRLRSLVDGHLTLTQHRGHHHRLQLSKAKEMITAMHQVIRFNESETVHLVTSTIGLLHDAIFGSNSNDLDDDHITHSDHEHDDDH